MADLRDQLRETLRGRVCLVGLGNLDLGDDGFGVRLAERLSQRGTRNAERGRPKAEHEPWRHGLEPFPFPEGEGQISGEAPAEPARGNGWIRVIAATQLERCIGRLADGGFDTVLFLDAVEFGATPGSVVLLNSREMAARFPQISTHKISLGSVAQLIEAEGRTNAWLLGVQPASLRTGGELSPPVQAAVEIVSQVIAECAVPPAGVLAGRPARSAFRIPHSALPC